MVSEIDNLLKGQVVATAEYSNSRKIIGVSNEHITEDPTTGYCPLGKQGAFIKEESALETFDAVVKASDAVEETLDFSAAPAGPAPISLEPAAAPQASEAPKFVLPEATVSDIAVGNPVEVAPVDTLQTMILDKPVEDEPAPVVEPEKEEVPTELSLPEMSSEVIASAPTGIDEGLFVGNDIPAVSNLEAAPLPQTESPAPAAPSVPTGDVDANKVNEIVSKLLDQLQGRLTKLVQEEIENYKKDLNSVLNNKEEATIEKTAPEVQTLDAPAAPTTPAPEEDSLMADAIDQIKNMVVPELDVPTL